ncbi:MAG: type II toxin-antitoxin system HicB family antitoxin [Chloroflexi bacterium]|nr:type II toxin-antitoxin system HicB family antitoxin [Chloroflexota bacterium]
MKPMTYKNYAARIEYSDEDECFVGRVIGIRDIITFHGESVAEIRQAFLDAVDFYLETCAERGESPQKPYSGRLMLRVPSETHAAVAQAAALSGKSINQWASEKLSKAAQS